MYLQAVGFRTLLDKEMINPTLYNGYDYERACRRTKDAIAQESGLKQAFQMNKVRRTENKLKYGNADKNDLKDYVFTVSDLGWMNVDRILKDYPTAPKRILAVNETDLNALVFVVAKDNKSYIKLKHKNGRWVSPPLPEGMDIKVVSVKMKQGSFSMALHDKTIQSRDESLSLAYQACSIVEMKQKLGEL